MLEPQNEHFTRDFLKFSHFVASKSTFSYKFSYEPQNLLPQNWCFVRGFHQFQHISKNVMPTMQFAPCRHLTQPWHCDSWKTLNMTRLKCCACYAKWRWRSPKRCACHKKCNPSSENVARVLRLPDQTSFDMLWNMLKCREVPRLPRKRGYTTSDTSKSDHFCRTRHRHGHTDLTRTLANGCGRLRTFANGCATSSEHTLNPPQSKTGTLATHSRNN